MWRRVVRGVCGFDACAVGNLGFGMGVLGVWSTRWMNGWVSGHEMGNVAMRMGGL